MVHSFVFSVLILGGTTFLGPHLAEELHRRGAEVTLFHRGTSSPISLDFVSHIYGDREKDLTPLVGKHWDVIIDTSGHLPLVVESSSQILAQATEHYTFISTIGVYDNFTNTAIDESAPVAQLLELSPKEITESNYGALKAACERVVEAYFPGKFLIIRPGLIVGPYDPTGRFIYWLKRMHEGGEVLVPDVPQQHVQFIDVRDLAKWVVDMVERRAVGVYHATGPAQPMTFTEWIDACVESSLKEVQLCWVQEKFLLDQQVRDWSDLPLWLSSERKMPGFMQIHSRKAIQAGLTFRPLSETIRDTLAWDCEVHNPQPPPGLKREKEQELLEKWKLQIQ